MPETFSLWESNKWVITIFQGNFVCIQDMGCIRLISEWFQQREYYWKPYYGKINKVK